MGKGQKIRGFFTGEKGQRTFNYAYNIGASIVILGALFKVLHLPGADPMLILGMGTEACIFFLSAFDEPVITPTDAPAMPVAMPSASAPATAAPVVMPSAAAPVAMPAMPDMSPALTQMGASLESLQESLKGLEQVPEFARQLEELNKNVQGLNAIYSLQLKSVSAGLGSIEQINQKNQELAQNLQQLNEAYSRMIAAMQGKS